MEGFCIKCHIVIPQIQGEYCFKCGTRLFVRPSESQIGFATDLVVGTPATVDVGPPSGEDSTDFPRAAETRGVLPFLEPKSTDGTNYPPLQSQLSGAGDEDTILVRRRTIPDRIQPDIDSGLRVQSTQGTGLQELGRIDRHNLEQSYAEQPPKGEAVNRSTFPSYSFVNRIPRSRDSRSRSPARLGSEELGSRHRDPRHSSTSLYSDSRARGSPTPVTSLEELSLDETITPARLTHMKRVISNLKTSKFSENFRKPVDYVALSLPSYPKIIKTPIDLETIDRKLKDKRYTMLSEFVADFDLIVDNCARFNGPEHSITQIGRKMQMGFRNQMRKLPPATTH